ncbi:hypothetical protein K6U54_08465, partial [Vibrio alginolyticus]|uniref:hypothetical protein n=1 Tax=Vibrio alginolyticus TaxID=663 RepID=UPI001EEB52CB
GERETHTLLTRNKQQNETSSWEANLTHDQSKTPKYKSINTKKRHSEGFKKLFSETLLNKN